MGDLQKRFDGLLALIYQNLSNALAAECYAITEGEIALTAPAENTVLPTGQTMAKIMELSHAKHTNASVLELIAVFNSIPNEKIAIWYIDSDNGQYIIATNTDTTKLIGIAKAETTLTDIRKKYFLQKETLEKIGEKLPFDYGATENSFFNRQLI